MRYIKNKPESKPSPQEVIHTDIPASLDEIRSQLDTLYQFCSDIVIREFVFGNPETRGLMVYFDGLVNKDEIENNILRPLLLDIDMLDVKGDLTHRDIINDVKTRIISPAELKGVKTWDELIRRIGSGDCALLIDGYGEGLVAGTRSWQSRGIESPDNEVVIFGPKEGFNETLRFNTAQLRRRIKSSNFKIESFVLGRITKTDVIICYIKNIAPDSMVEEVKKRVNGIDIDGILDTNYIKEFIIDDNKTLFSQVMHTERPDRVCGQLLEGKICILVDGSPMALVLPSTFTDYITTPDDYYTYYIPASLLRLLRFTAFWMSLLLPSLYVAVITYHHEMIPTALLLTIAASREGVPFPSFVEALLLEAMFEMLREAGLRLPRAVGPAVSIVGALIIGDAAVRAGLVSTPMVVVVAATGIASFVTPSYNASLVVRILRFGFLFASAVLGFLGIMIVLVIVLLKMVSLSSFGVPYLAPLAPLNLAQISDIMVRRPWFVNRSRPYLEGMRNQQRQGNGKDEGG
ncbi:MAG: spore germination protein [Syntrophomonadaceae bacterium]|nr:spore germination protein [Syntrophomonadaceae bacterium]